MDFIEKIGELAGKLDDAGFDKQAQAVDAILEKIALGERAFDIDLHYVVSVRADVYSKVQDPSAIPVNAHLGAEGTIVVHPVSNNQVGSEVLFNQKFNARNLNELRAKMAPVVNQLKVKFSPASADETIEYKPVAAQGHAAKPQPPLNFTMGPAQVR